MQISNLTVNDVILLVTFFNLRGSAKGFLCYLTKGGGSCYVFEIMYFFEFLLFIQILQDHDDEVWFLQFSHNGSYMASASKDCTAIIWEVCMVLHYVALYVFSKVHSVVKKLNLLIVKFSQNENHVFSQNLSQAIFGLLQCGLLGSNLQSMFTQLDDSVL